MIGQTSHSSEPDAPKEGRDPYEAPNVIVHGKLEDLTRDNLPPGTTDQFGDIVS